MTIQERLPPGKYRLSVEDYVNLAESGAFGDARTELIEGEIWIMSPAHSRHARAQSRLDHALRNAIEAAGLSLEVFTAPSIATSESTAPEPDLVVAEDHDGGLLPLAKVRIVIEISDTTLTRDRGEKARLYAAAGIPEYWVVDIEGRVVHQLWQPQGGTYTGGGAIGFGEGIVAKAVSGLRITLPAG